MFNQWVNFDDVECEVDTEKAILVNLEGSNEWIPKNQISDDSEVYQKGTSGTLIISEWIAKQKNLI